MLNDSDVALARVAENAYLSPLVSLPAGFTPVSQSALGLQISLNESYSNGVYTNLNAVADVLVGEYQGKITAVLAFRGSDDRQDSINDLQNINNEYTLFKNIIQTFDAWVTRQNIGQVVVTGHSLGGAMTQLYMHDHANTATTSYVGETFGSPGALVAAGTDDRINNVVVSDDPAVWLGENRASVGSDLQSNPALAAAAVFAGPEVFPGLTSTDVINSIGDLNRNYVNNGAKTYLPAADGSYTFINSINEAVNAGKSEHVITTYLSRLQQVTGASGDAQLTAGITPTTVGTQVFRFFEKTDGTHFYTTSATESDSLKANRSDLVYEGVGLNATKAPSSDANSVPVFRFFDTVTGSHFYTISDQERQSVQSSRPDLKYEGIGFYEHATQQSGDAPVYRFFDTTTGNHFYTASTAEDLSVLASRADLHNEGIAFYTLSA